MAEDQRPLLPTEHSFSPRPKSAKNWISITASPESNISRSRYQVQKFLNSKLGHYAVLALVVLDVSCIFLDFIIQLFTCEQKHPKQGWMTTLEVLGIASLVFSSLFMVELIASIWAFGFSYFKSKFHCIDALVIIAGFIIDILLRGILEEVASLVVVLRLWRVFKIIEELSVGAEEQMEDLQEKVRQLTEENERLRTENERLRAGHGD